MRFLLAIGLLFTSMQAQAQTYGWGGSHNGTLSSSYGQKMGVDGDYSIGFGLDPTAPTTITTPNTMAIMGGNVGVGTTAPAADLSVSGTIQISDGGQTCDATTQGSQRYNSTDKAMEYCNSTDWVQINATADSSGTPPVWPSGTGYFVLSSARWTGNLGRRTGADAKCLTDLTNNTWLNKGSATLDSSHVKAFICEYGTCNNLMPDTTYTFARSGSATNGGATFTADATGAGPQNRQNWSAVNYFGVANEYWTNRASTDSTTWALTGNSSSPGATNCYGFSSGASGTAASIGYSQSGSAGRWRSNSSSKCNNVYNMICIVHP